MNLFFFEAKSYKSSSLYFSNRKKRYNKKHTILQSMKLLFVSQALIQLRKPKLQKPNTPNLHNIK